MGPYGSIGAHIKTGRSHTSKSRLAVDREFMYIGSAGPGRADGRKARRADGGRADGRRADGRAEGRTDGRRADGRTSGRADGRAQQYNDDHQFSTILNDSATIFIDVERF